MYHTSTSTLIEEEIIPTEEKESDKQSEHKTQSPLGTVAPSRPGSQTTISIPTGSEVASSPTNEQPLVFIMMTGRSRKTLNGNLR
jgi:hypothetical protein